MHPIERLRFVARDSGAPDEDVVAEAAGALARFAGDPAALVTACRRLIERHPANGAVWWLCARTLLAADPEDEAWRCHSDLHADPTLDEVAHALADGARVAVVGWPDRLGAPLSRRGDLEVHVIDVDGDGPGFVRMLERLDVDAIDIPTGGLAVAVAGVDVLLLDARAIGPEVSLVGAGGWAAAAVAHHARVPVWLVSGRGRSLPAGLWAALERALAGPTTPPWNRGVDLLPLDLVSSVVGPTGLLPAGRALATVDVPDAPELRR